jgi:DNA-binding NtrC family response regulator
LDKVLIIAREEVVAALLGLMVELQGSQPSFLGWADTINDAIVRESPNRVLIDCDYPDCGEDLIKAVMKAGAVPILFSPFRVPSEVQAFAARHGVRSFTLPTDTDTFGKVLRS